MSITKIRSTFENKGCQAVMIVIGLLLAIGLMNTGTCSFFGDQMGKPAEPGDAAIVTVAGTSVTAKSLEELLKNSPNQSSNPEAEFYNICGALDQQMTNFATASLIKSKGVTVTDEQAQSWFQQQIDQSMMMYRFQMMQNGMLKPNATEKDFEAEFLKREKRTVQQAKDEALKNFKEQMKLPEQASKIKIEASREALVTQYSRLSSVTEKDLKESFDEFQFATLRFDNSAKSIDVRNEEAKKAKAELESGKKPAEVAAKYLTLKKTSAVTYNRSSIQLNPNLKGLDSLKVGEASDVINEYGTPVIFIVEKISPKLPPDFDKEKAKLLENYKKQLANIAVDADINALKSPEKAQWGSEAYKIAFELYKALQSNAVPAGPARTKAMEEFESRLATPQQGDSIGDKLRAVARYVAFRSFYFDKTPKEQAELRAKRIDVLSALLEYTEDAYLRLDLYDAYLADGDKDQALDNLKLAAELNTQFDQQGDLLNTQVQTRLTAAEKAKTFDAADLEEVKKEMKRWADDKAEDAKEKAEQAKEQAKVDAELDKADQQSDTKDKKETPQRARPLQQNQPGR